MRYLKLLLQREPAAIGSMAASVLPVLVLLGVIKVDEAGIAAIVVAINTIVGVVVRVAVSPVATPAAPAQAPAPQMQSA
jgi:hypothetical protein